MKTSSFRSFTTVVIIAVTFGLILALSGAQRVYADESLDKMLTTAMENHPDIVAAKAKVALAEAELNATRLQVARQIIALWGAKNSQVIAKNQIEIQLNQSPDYLKREVLMKNLEDARVKLEQTETEMKYLTEKAAPVVLQNISSNASTVPPKEPQYPGGPIVEELTKGFCTGTIEFSFVDTPLQQVKEYMQDYIKYPIYLDTSALEDAGISSDRPITMNMAHTPLPAALQALQDQNQGWMFVIRDYGILLTTIDQAKAQGYYPALEFAKSIEQRKTHGTEKPETKPLERDTSGGVPRLD